MKPSRWIRLVAPLALVSLLAVGCEDQAPGSESEDEAVDQAEEAIATPTAEDAPRADRDHHGKRGKHGGPERIFEAALELEGLTDAQKATIQGLSEKTDRPAKDDAHHAAGKAFFESLATSVRAGKIDAEALAAEAEKLSPASHKDRDHLGFAKKLDTLHATLTSQQRSALVASIQEKMENHMAKKAERADKDPGDMGRNHKKGPLGMMLRGVDVSDAQREQISAALEKAGLGKDKQDRFAGRDSMKERMSAMFQAFASDSFDAASLMPAPPETGATHLADMAKALAVAVPVLNEAQRAQLADRLEQGPMHGPKGKHGDKASGRQGRGAMKHDRRGQSQ